MESLRYTLLADGTSDDALLPLLTWLLRQNGVSSPIQEQFANLQNLPRPTRGLPERIEAALDLYPCDLLFVHRDAEKEPAQLRHAEIASAALSSPVPVVAVVPVRMSEVWFLFDEQAIRRAAGNPNGKEPLDLPSPSRIESIPDPKEMLYSTLRTASGLSGRRLKRFSEVGASRLVSGKIESFAPLRGTPAFDALENAIAHVIEPLLRGA